MSHKKFGPDRFSRFDAYWLQTNKQTDRQTNRQAKFIYRYRLDKDLYLATFKKKQLCYFILESSIFEY